YIICQGQSLGELRHESFGPGISMRLKNTPDPVMRIISGSLQSSGNFCRMMSIVIDDCYASYFSLILESSVSTSEMEEAFPNDFCGQTDLSGKGYGRKSIGHIVDAWNRQRKTSDIFSLTDTVKGGMSCLV